MKRLTPIVLLACVLSSCWFSHKPKASTTAFTVVSVSADADATVGAGGAKAITEGTTIPLGGTITLTNGTVTVARGDTTLELRPAQPGQRATIALPALERAEVGPGLVLASIDQGAPVVLSSLGVIARAQETAQFRFDRLLSVRIGTYAGRVNVSVGEDEGADTLEVGELDEVLVSGRVLPRTVSPYSIDATDPWDKKNLGDVIALDQALRTQSLGFQRQAGAHFGSVSALGRLARDSGVDLSFVSPYLGSLTSGDIVIGVQLALLVARAQRQDPASLFGRFLTSFEAGATWGQLARKNGMVTELRHGVERAVAVLFGQVRTSPSPTVTPSTSPTSTPTQTPTRSPTSTPTTPPPQTLGAPSALTAENGTCNILVSISVELAWRPSSSHNADGYEIFRRESGGSFTLLASVDGRDETQYSDLSAKFSTKYDYKVRATRGRERSGFSNTASVTTQSNLCQ